MVVRYKYSMKYISQLVQSAAQCCSHNFQGKHSDIDSDSDSDGDSDRDSDGYSDA